MRNIVVIMWMFLAFALISINEKVFAREAKHNVLDVSNSFEAKVLIKVLNKEIGLTPEQKVRLEKLFEAYIRRVELAYTIYAENDEKLKKRLSLLEKYRNETFKRELGEEKYELYEMMAPSLPKKIAEMKKLISQR
ncbi:MAG: hypothetical protein RMJ53_05845 [Chitinophagales bacterium]|nr:hypothetical protein [Chitinophagales bacterium]